MDIHYQRRAGRPERIDFSKVLAGQGKCASRPHGKDHFLRFPPRTGPGLLPAHFSAGCA